MIDARLDFSVNVVRATQQLCREIGKVIMFRILISKALFEFAFCGTIIFVIF